LRIEKDEGAERLILRGGRNLALHGQVVEELGELCLAERGRVARTVKVKETRWADFSGEPV
jgi:hypothetical protein